MKFFEKKPILFSHHFYFKFLFLTTSYISTPAATDALSEFISPHIGKDIIPSHFLATKVPMPLPSLPITKAVAPL